MFNSIATPLGTMFNCQTPSPLLSANFSAPLLLMHHPIVQSVHPSLVQIDRPFTCSALHRRWRNASFYNEGIGQENGETFFGSRSNISVAYSCAFVENVSVVDGSDLWRLRIVIPVRVSRRTRGEALSLVESIRVWFWDCAGHCTGSGERTEWEKASNAVYVAGSSRYRSSSRQNSSEVSPSVLPSTFAT
jgi:hypothetical protein